MPTPLSESMHPTTGKGCNPEEYGGYGEKEPMPARPSSGSSDDGSHDLGPQQADAAYHKNPAISAYPDNLQGAGMHTPAGDSGNPTAAEGATGPENY